MTRACLARRIAWLFATAALLAACAAIPLKEREQAERDLVLEYAGAPVDHYTWLGRYDGWKPLSANEVLVWTTPSQAYLIRVAPPCEDLRFASHIGLTSTMHTVYTHMDFVKVRHWRCPISEIRPVDYGRLRHDLRQKAEQDKAAS